MTGGVASQQGPATAPPPQPRRRLLPEPRPRHELAAAAVFLFLLTLTALGRVLFADGNRVLSDEDGDLAMQFVHWRAFGFGEMRAGHLPLWNPHIFSGAPFLGGFQSALLYPPNWLYLVLPLARAINIGIALHVFLAGFFMYLWARECSLKPLACTFAAVLFMFCGPHYPHIYAGHLPNLCAIAWGPLIFLAIDRWLGRRSVGAILLGGGAFAMQILAGHPQYVFYTGIAAGLYSAARLFSTKRPFRAAAGLALIPVIAAALSAAQLLEGFHAAGQSLRSHGVTFTFAALFSFPPENILTLVAPGFFGGLKNLPYWGRCAYWEMSLFFGVTGVVFAIYGAISARVRARFELLGVAMILLLLALGRHTPVFEWLYWHVPGFDKFRGQSKFTFPAILFLIMLAASGFDALLNSRRSPDTLIGASATGALILGLCGWRLSSTVGNDAWAGWMHRMFASSEVLLSSALTHSPKFQAAAARHAAHGLLLGAGTLILLVLILLAGRRWPRAYAGVLVLACVEMLLFANSTLKTFSLAGAQESPATDYLGDHPAPAGSRILNLENPNIAMSIGARDLWGYDPGVVRRYAQWMAESQGIDADHLDEELLFTRQPPLYGPLLRCCYILSPEGLMAANNGELPVFRYPDATLAPRLSLVSGTRVIPGRTQIFEALRDPAFDPRQTVILETPPTPLPAAGDGPAGTATLLAETTDSLTIEAELSRPAILLITDTFCTGWMVRSLLPPGVKGSGQSAYGMLPGDYCLRAIPLSAGHHRFQVVYRPLAFVVGAWISGVALVLYLLAWAAIWRRLPFRPG